jgi:ribulose bisphosphate carboxylase small subunit
MSREVSANIQWPDSTRGVFGIEKQATFSFIVDRPNQFARNATVTFGIYILGTPGSSSSTAFEDDSNRIGSATTTLTFRQFQKLQTDFAVTYSVSESDVRSLPDFKNTNLSLRLGYKVDVEYDDDRDAFTNDDTGSDRTEFWSGENTPQAASFFSSTGRRRPGAVPLPENTGGSRDETDSVRRDASKVTEFQIKDIVINDLFYTGRIFEDSQTILFREESSIGINNPSIAIDSAGRFATHEIIGGGVVRQKIGQDALEVTINGVCFDDTAKRIDALRFVTRGTIKSDRFDGGSLDVHFGSSSTEPMVEGDAINLETNRRLYAYTINAVEVN